MILLGILFFVILFIFGGIESLVAFGIIFCICGAIALYLENKEETQRFVDGMKADRLRLEAREKKKAEKKARKMRKRELKEMQRKFYEQQLQQPEKSSNES